MFLFRAAAVFVLALAGVANANIIIAKECDGNKVKGHYGRALERIQSAGEQLAKVVTNAPDANKHVKNLALILFKQQAIRGVSDRLKELHRDAGEIIISDKDNDATQDAEPQEDDDGDIEMADDPQAGAPSENDVVVYCTEKQYERLSDPPDQYFHKIWDFLVPATRYAGCFDRNDPNNRIEAFTTVHDDENVPDTPDITQLCPWLIEEELDNMESLSCVNLQSGVQSVKEKFEKGEKTTADGYADFVHTLVYELTHTKIGGESRVTINEGGEQGNTWEGCVKLKDDDLADSLAFFTTMVNLIEQCGLKPKEDGTIETTKKEEPGSDGEEKPEAEPKP